MTVPFSGKSVALAVTGSIAAYKAVEVARLLIKAGTKVIPVMTRSAEKFVGPATFAGICGERVYDDMWDPSFSGEMHVAIANRADLIAVVPATADFLARLAQGRADDLITALVLSSRGPVLVAPAMHPRMWSSPATALNVETLRKQGKIGFIGPVHGEVASGERGVGRMAEPQAIADAIIYSIQQSSAYSGRHLLISAGPTVEDLDPVRFLGNRSSGKMGFAIAEAAAARGAQVTLVAGPVSLPTPAGNVRRVDVRSALEMREAMHRAGGQGHGEPDVVIMCAAVADYRAKEIAAAKIKKGSDEISVSFVKNPDILAEIGKMRAARKSPVLVGFAVESGDDDAIAAYAKKKLVEKSVDIIVANAADVAFGGDDNRALFVSKSNVEPMPSMSKRALADRILDRVLDMLKQID
ncbi:MAG: bifunctional phosphopantothenoylcysteine decarboxylase/phosphopantothenate--cysteine ligase CoaBC [Polyangiaceae bacterium]